MRKLSSAVFVAVVLTSCTGEKGDPLHEGCIEISMTEQMQGMEESDRYSVKQGVEQGCKIVVSECEKDPDGEMCKAFKLKFIQ